MPFGIDMWVAEQRAKATEYVAKLGVQDKFLYNSITPWDKDIKGQVHKLKDLGIKHVVIQAFDDQDQSPAGRLKSLEALLAQAPVILKTDYSRHLRDEPAFHLIFSCCKQADKGKTRSAMRRGIFKRNSYVG